MELNLPVSQCYKFNLEIYLQLIINQFIRQIFKYESRHKNCLSLIEDDEMKEKINFKIWLLAIIISARIINAENLDIAVKELRKFQFQQLNYCYQKFLRFEGLYKSSPYVMEADIAATGFALAGLISATENGLIPIEDAKNIAIETINTCIKLQKDTSQSYLGFLYHYYIYNEFVGKLDHKPGVEVSTIDTSLLLAGIITAGEYFNSKGYPEVRKSAQEFYSNINWKGFYDEKRGLFYMAWRGKFEGYWDFYSDEILLISLLAQGSPVPEHRVDIRQSFGNIKIQKGKYKNYEYVYSWYGSLFTYLFAHVFIDFRKLGKDTIFGIDWWQNSKNAILADIEWCQEHNYPQDIWGISACWSKIQLNSDDMEYRGRIGAALCGALDEWERIDNDKNGIKPVAPHASIACLPFFDDLPILENPAFKNFSKIRNRAVDRSGLIIQSLDASRVDENGIPQVNSHWLVGMDIIYPVLMIENYFTGLIWENFMSNSCIQLALLKTFPAYYLYLAKK